MTLSKVEHVLGIMRAYLIECTTQNDWGDHRTEELAHTIAACIRKTTDETCRQAPERDPRLARDALRRAIHYVNDNPDSKPGEYIAAVVGIDRFTFGRSFMGPPA
jgi:hypothetical protein